jgi:acyl dehydratase
VDQQAANLLAPVGAFGSYEDALRFIGYKTPLMKADVPLDLSVMYAHLGVLCDDNPSYWDVAYAERMWGARIAPSALLFALFAPLRWSPKPSGVGMVARMIVPLPGTTLINVATEEVFHRPLRIGDWLSRTETVESISPEKRTGLGVGHFVGTRMAYFDEAGEQVATGTNTLFRFTPAAPPGDAT